MPVGVAAATRACAAAPTKGSVAVALVRSVRSNDAQTKVSAARSDCTSVLASTIGWLGSRLPRAPSSSRTPNDTLTEVGQRSRSESVRKALSVAAEARPVLRQAAAALNCSVVRRP